VIWKATSSLGFSATTGNANVISLSGGANVSRNDGMNKVALNLEGIYGFTKSKVLANDMNGNGVADVGDEIGEQQTTTAAFFLGKLRYDRFFTANNSGYISVATGLDRPASKQVFVAGQAGYARHILKTDMHDLSVELGYDLTYDRLIPPDMPPPAFLENVLIHSGRIYLGYLLSIRDHSALRASAEALINFNPLFIGDRDVGVGQATRFIGKVEFTTKIWKPLSFRAAFTARYNNAPALSTALMYSPDNPDRYNQTLDTLTELGLVVNFI